MGWVVPDKGNQYLEQGQQKKLIAADLLASLLELGMERGDFAERDPLLGATTALGMVNVPFILFHTGKVDDPAFRDKMVDEVLSPVDRDVLKRQVKFYEQSQEQLPE